MDWIFTYIYRWHLPSPKPTTKNGVSTPHADFATWFRQDRLLFGALVGTLSPLIIPLVTKTSSSLEVWNILSKTYANPSHVHIKQLHHRLKQSTKTNDQTIKDYMQSVKTLVDELNILGKKLDKEYITDAIINGLNYLQNNHKCCSCPRYPYFFS